MSTLRAHQASVEKGTSVSRRSPYSLRSLPSQLRFSDDSYTAFSKEVYKKEVNEIKDLLTRHERSCINLLKRNDKGKEKKETFF